MPLPSLDQIPAGFEPLEEQHMLNAKCGPYGYHPMRLGEQFKGFEIVRKLGWGTAASVWLAKEQAGKCRIVALKVLTTNATHGYRTGQTFEIKIVKKLGEITRDGGHALYPGLQYLATPFNVLSLQSVHGDHYCYTTRPCGLSLGNVLDHLPSRRFSLPVLKRITKQILLALECLHDVVEATHADMHIGNILVKLQASDSDIQRYLEENPSQIHPPQYDLHVSAEPIITVKSQPLPNIGTNTSLTNIEICLVDYSASIPKSSMRPESLIVAPDVLQAPEQILGHPWSHPVDIWALGCVVVESLTCEELFGVPAFLPYRAEWHLARIFKTFGSFPRTFLERCRKASKYFDNHGRLLESPKLENLPLEQRLKDSDFSFLREELSLEHEFDDTCRFLPRCFTIDPAIRPTASELLQDSWLRS
ncbi:kinase-like domain-containing protein [Cubamyces menziesii]|nr:kinase-like domain-containing protein [Cubamyces menziesii]